ncbi:MAG: YceI family protein [Terriglobales bacterium]
MPTRIKFLLAVALFTAASLFAQEQVFQLDTTQSQVEFTLRDVLHTVHGKFRLQSGILRFNPTTGTASGELVLDANSGDSGSNARDKKMKRDVLETQNYPTIVFTPQKIVGTVVSAGGSQVQMQGLMSLHGQQHAMTLVVPVMVNGNSASAEVHFVVPFVQWGLKDPSTLFLRVSKTVDIDVHAVGTLTSQTAAAPASQ